MARKSRDRLEIEKRIGELMAGSEEHRRDAEACMQESAHIETVIRELQNILDTVDAAPGETDEQQTEGDG